MFGISFEKSVGAVLYREEGENLVFLLVRYRSGQWDFPKGHVEENETEEETMRREIKEETGIEQIELLPGFRKASNYFYTAKGNEKKERLDDGRGIYIFKKAIYFAAKSLTDNVVIDFENKGYAWLSFEQALKRLGNDASRKILNELYQKLQKQK